LPGLGDLTGSTALQGGCAGLLGAGSPEAFRRL
jgi:hypothetical protein